MNVCGTISILIIESLKISEGNISCTQDIFNIFNSFIVLLLMHKINCEETMLEESRASRVSWLSTTILEMDSSMVREEFHLLISSKKLSPQGGWTRAD